MYKHEGNSGCAAAWPGRWSCGMGKSTMAASAPSATRANATAQLLVPRSMPTMWEAEVN
jgi:hypothetical protein